MQPQPPPHFSALEASYLEHGYWLRESFSHFFDRTCKRMGPGIAVVDGAVRLTFTELAAGAESVARGLAARGIGPGSVVALQLPNWWETVVLYAALIRLGAVLNPILPAYRERELEFMLREGGARMLVIPDEFRKFDHRSMAATLRERIPSLRDVVVIRGKAADGETDWAALTCSPRAELPRPPRGEDLLLLMYTSGTTADPKGVLHSHRTLLYEVRSLERVHGLGTDDTTLMPSPLTHISGLIHAALAPFALGSRAVLMEQWNGDAALELIKRESVTYMVGAPVFLSDLTFHPRLEEIAPRSLRLFSCGGAGVSAGLILESRRRLGCVSKRVYGSTEFPTLTTTGPDDPPERGASSEGRAIWAAELRIVDDEGGILPPGREGEIQARGPECFLGYRDPALDAEAFTSEGWFRTGDLGVLDDDGYLTITGRKKDIVIRKGEKISAPEIEGLIARHPAVADVAIVAVPDPATGERACACIVLRRGHSLDLSALCEFLRGQGLPAHKLPERFEVLKDLPRTATGKVQKHRLRSELES